MKYIIGFLLLCASSLMAQEQNYLKDYFPNIQEAEMNIINFDYLHAIEAYEKAFESVDRGHLKDYFNAAVCATYLGDASKTYGFLSKTAEKGLSLDFVKNEVAFFAIQKDKEWREFELKFLEKKRIAEASQNKELKRMLNILDARANWFREKNAETFADTIAMIDVDNAILLDSLINKYGFPGEDEIGIGQGGFPVIQYAFYEIIKRHTLGDGLVNFSNKIIEATRQGKITPHIAAYLLMHHTDDDQYFMRNVFMIKADPVLDLLLLKHKDRVNQYVYVELSEDEERSFNQLRENFGLESLTDYRKKVWFSLQDHRFLQPYKMFANIWFVRDLDLIDEYLENTVILN